MTTGHRDDRHRVRIPADVERPDRILAGLTARQLAILGVGALILWAGYATTRHLIPVAAYGAAALPVAVIAALLALGRLEGVAADRWVGFAWRHHRSPRRLVPAPDGIPLPPAFLDAATPTAPDVLRLPLAGVDAGGVVDLGPDGLAVICRACAVTFGLRTPAEQEALVASFARWLNSLELPVQLLVRAEPVDLTSSIDALLDAAPALPHPALEAAARDHAAFLADLAARRDLLRREVLVVLRHGGGPDAASRLHRRAEAAEAALAAAGVTLTALNGPSAAACLARALDPAGERRPAGLDSTDEAVTLAAATTRDRR